MSMGIIVKGSNSVFFGRWLVFIFEVCTGLIIILGLFGWMDVLIIAKWFYTMNPYANDPKISTAPSIITAMVNIYIPGGAP